MKKLFCLLILFNNSLYSQKGAGEYCTKNEECESKTCRIEYTNIYGGKSIPTKGKCK